MPNTVFSHRSFYYNVCTVLSCSSCVADEDVRCTVSGFWWGKVMDRDSSNYLCLMYCILSPWLHIAGPCTVQYSTYMGLYLHTVHTCTYTCAIIQYTPCSACVDMLRKVHHSIWPPIRTNYTCWLTVPSFRQWVFALFDGRKTTISASCWGSRSSWALVGAGCSN